VAEQQSIQRNPTPKKGQHALDHPKGRLRYFTQQESDRQLQTMREIDPHLRVLLYPAKSF